MVHHRDNRRDPSMRILCFLGFCSILSPGLLGQRKGLSIVKQWKELDYTYATPAARQHAKSTGEFVPRNGGLIDMDVYYAVNGLTKIFVTIPRFQDGIPATLATVSKDTLNGSSLLQPYPSWEWHRNSRRCNRDRLVSVFRTQIDECGRLWVLDTGKIGSNQLCAAQLIAFDPNTDRVVHRFQIPKGQILQSSILVTPVVDVRDPHGGCKDTFIYAADTDGFGLIVYDVRRNRSWRVQNKLFYPTPAYGTFTIAGESFDLMDGVLGMAISPYKPGQDRILYFHSLASNTENYVYTSVLRNETIFQEDSDAEPRKFSVYSNKRPSQSAAEAIDKNGIMYFGLLHEIAMACWNINTDYDQRNFDVFDTNAETLQFPSGVKIINNRKGQQELWVLTCRFQKSMTGTMNSDEINFRIQAASTADILNGSKCKAASVNSAGSTGGGYGLVNQPSYSRTSSYTASTSKLSDRKPLTSTKRETTNGDQLIFSN